ncbi:SipW-dependent-type signal peptide-containing protein [Cryobacterium sp. Y62]|uniref:SipW-dependent-type signal peptide-containing protein n=1 Tax=Cryobacterium sp. Y62 TaxID=2048284 RepID=UPI000CE57186|nr:SipW-dependent-type signal peptide-containing protein [Cryobacterium sp. Y62]
MKLHITPARRLARKRARRGKIMAILAGGAVLGLGTTATVAAWTDTEWVFGGGAGGTGAGVGTSIFEVEQNVSSSPFNTAVFVQDEANPGQALTFGLGALSLTPGDSVYAPVALRTVTNSVAGNLMLEPAVAAAGVTVVDASAALWSALTLQVWVSETAFTCDASTVVSTTTPVITEIANGALSTTGGAAAQALSAASANTQYYCFKVTLPSNAQTNQSLNLQGRTVAPAWEFSAVSS